MNNSKKFQKIISLLLCVLLFITTLHLDNFKKIYNEEISAAEDPSYSATWNISYTNSNINLTFNFENTGDKSMYLRTSLTPFQGSETKLASVYTNKKLSPSEVYTPPAISINNVVKDYTSNPTASYETAGYNSSKYYVFTDLRIRASSHNFGAFIDYSNDNVNYESNDPTYGSAYIYDMIIEHDFWYDSNPENIYSSNPSTHEPSTGYYTTLSVPPSTSKQYVHVCGKTILGRTVKAVYEVPATKQFTVKYNVNGGSGSLSSHTVWDGLSVNLRTTKPTKTGHTFVSWNTKSDGSGESYEPGDTINPVTKNITLYAQYVQNPNKPYKVQHWQQKVGGNASTQNSTNYTLKDTDNLSGPYGSVVTPSVKTYEGFNSPSTQSLTIKSDGSAVLNYYYTRKNYTVTYNATENGGTGNTTASVQYGASVDLSKTASKEGWTFVGWSQNKDATSKTSSLTMPAKNVTLYAIFSKTITRTQYDSNGKSNTESHTIYNKDTNADFTIKSASTYSGWTHYGWTNSTSNSASSNYSNGNITLSNSLTIYALYERNIKLTYSTSSIINPEDGVLMPEGTTVITPATVPSTSTFKQTTNAYSITNWTTKNYTIGSPGNWTGFTFSYWGENGHYNTSIKSGNTYTLKNSTTMYPVWQRNKYKVTYDYWTNGGDSVNIKTSDVYYQYSVNLDPVATKKGDSGIYSSSNTDGWQFVGWNTDPNATEALETFEMPANDVTLYAIYKKQIKLTLVDISDLQKMTKNYVYIVYNNTTSIQHKLPELFTCMYDPTSGMWQSDGWTSSQSSSGEAEYLENENFTLWQDQTLYGLYKRDLITTFISYNGEEQKIETVSCVQKTNASNMKSLTTPDITTPNAYIYTGNSINGSWTFRGWTTDTSNNPSSVTKANVKINNPSKKTYYAIYDRDLTITYYDYSGSKYTTTIDKAPQSTSSYNINKYNCSTLKIKNINNYTNWNKSYWSNSPTQLNNFMSEGTNYSVTNNIELYAIYNRPITVTYVLADSESIIDNKTQYANSSDIEGTKTIVKFNTIYTNMYYDDKGYEWSGYYWTTDYNRKTDEIDISIGQEISIKESITLYSVYETMYNGIFKSIKGSQENTKTISGLAYMNSNNPSLINNPTITTPVLQNNTYDGKSWSKLGWTTGKETNSSVIADENQNYILTGDTTFYGLYSVGVPVTFIDYNNEIKRERIINVGQTMNTFNKKINQNSAITPAIGIYKDTNGDDWEILGWTSTTDAKATVEFETEDELILNGNFIYYAVYRKPIELTLIDYNKTIKNTSVLKNFAYTNSKDVSIIQDASFTIPAQNNCTLNNNAWFSRGWTDTETSLIINYTKDSVIYLNKNMTLYGIYNSAVNVIYDGNGGISNIENSSGNKWLNSSGYESNPSIIITNSYPSRKGYKFQNLWASNTNSGNKYIPGNAYTFTQDITLYAQWGIETIDKTLTVIFEDNNNTLASRPDNIVITLKRDGEKITSYLVSTIDNTVCYPVVNKTIPSTGLKINIDSSKNSFEYKFEELQKYSPTDGHEYVYTVEQDTFVSSNLDVEYTTTYEDDTFKIINTVVNSNAKKVIGTISWDDQNNAWYLRPSKITLTLLKTDPDTNKATYITKTYPVNSSALSFDYSFDNLEAINADGNAYIYEVILPKITNYVTYKESGVNNNIEYFNFTNVLNGMPGQYVGGEGNRLEISADAFDIDHNLANRDDYFNIAATEDNVILLTLKEVLKSWNGTDKNATEVYDINTYTGNEYNIIISPSKNTIVDYLYDGKYEIVMKDNTLFNFDKFSAATSELYNATLTQEDGRYFITYSSKHEYSAIINLHAQVLLKPWRGYTSTQELYREKDWTIID
jgi:uncharacterized repeat protein (TIGR02543 family)